MLVKYPMKRITINDCIKHHWFTKMSKKNSFCTNSQSKNILEKIKNF